MNITWENRRNLNLPDLSNEDKAKILEERLYMFPHITFDVIKKTLNETLEDLKKENANPEFLEGFLDVMNVVDKFSGQYVGDEEAYNDYIHSTNSLNIYYDTDPIEKTITRLIKKIDLEPISTYYELDRLLNSHLKKVTFKVSNGFREGYCRACGTIASSWINAKEEQNYNNEFIFKINAKEPVRIYDIIKREQDLRVATMYCFADFGGLGDSLNGYFK